MLALLATLGVSANPAHAGCLAPELRLGQRRVAVGDPIHISGRFWMNGCQDVAVCPDDGACDYLGPEPKPYRDVTIYLSGKQSVRLGTVDADDQGNLKLDAQVPNVPAGSYVLIGRDSSGSAIGKSYKLVHVVSRPADGKTLVIPVLVAIAVGASVFFFFRGRVRSVESQNRS